MRVCVCHYFGIACMRLNAKDILFRTKCFYRYCFSLQPCINTSTVAGDGEDNDCDGWIDEETNNGIGLYTERNN